MKTAQGRMGGVVLGHILVQAGDPAIDASDENSFERRTA